MTLINLGYLIIISLLMVLTEKLENPYLELVVVIILVVSVYIIYFRSVKHFLTLKEDKLIDKLAINKNSDVDVDKVKNIKLHSKIGFSTITTFVTDKENNLIYKVRLKDNVFQNYDILDMSSKKVGYIWKMGNYMYIKLGTQKCKVLLRKFMGNITIAVDKLPIDVSYDSDLSLLEFRDAQEKKQKYAKINITLEDRLITTNIKVTKEYPMEIFLLALAIITRLYYPGNN